MPLKVIGAGFGRTGTLSLKFALEQLGLGRCYHMVDVVGLPAAQSQWLTTAADGVADWAAMFDGFAAAVDFPVCLFYRQLADYYPDAKFILTTRDAEAWFASTQATIFGPATRERLKTMPGMAELIDKVLYKRGFAGRPNDRDHVIATYHAHNAAVRRDIPAHRLLDYDVTQGWDPLCAFLGVAKPAADFPRVNSRDEFAQMSDRLEAGAR